MINSLRLLKCSYTAKRRTLLKIFSVLPDHRPAELPIDDGVHGLEKEAQREETNFFTK